MVKEKEKKQKIKKEKQQVFLSKEEYSVLEEKADKLIECNNSLLRLRAEFENNRKRLEKEKEEFVRYANCGLIEQLLPVLDNFEHGLKNLSKHDKKVATGIEIIYNQLMGVLEKEGLERLKAKGEKFDPQIHHAVMQEESEEHCEETIIEEMQKGYRLKGKLIRPAMVKVGKPVNSQQFTENR
ncbi:MAG: nucleotide exchange factor GrpE [Candidatus Omnitrophica bacterium]|nr:nucleotide exchange factor GrpE [Candidatus Omnitrophota bacterium]